MSRNIFDDAYYARGASPFDPTVNDLEPDPIVVTDAPLNDGLISPISVWSSLKTREELDLILNATGLTDGSRGDVIVSTAGTIWTIAPGAVSLPKLADIATGSLMGRTSAGAGSPEVLTPAQVRTLLNVMEGATANSPDVTLLDRANHTGFQLAATISDFAAAVSGNADVAANTAKVTNQTHTGDVTGATTLTIAAGVVSNGKLANVPTQTFKGRTTAGTGAPEDLSLAQAKTLLGLTGTNSGDQTITLTGDITGSGTGSFAATIAFNSVTNAKAADMATATLKGRATAGTGDPEDLTVAQATALLDVFSSSVKGLAPASGGGTTNFLRADGTWAAPAGGGGGSGDVAGPGSATDNALARYDTTTGKLIQNSTALLSDAGVLTVAGSIQSANSGKTIEMYHNGSTRGFIESAEEIVILAPNLLLGSTTNHVTLEYSGGYFNRGTLFHDDTYFNIGTSDYGENNTFVRIQPAGAITYVVGRLDVSVLLSLPAGGTSTAPLRIPHGSAPTSPVNGDIWTTTAGLYARINGATIGPLVGGSPSYSANPQRYYYFNDGQALADGTMSNQSSGTGAAASVQPYPYGGTISGVGFIRGALGTVATNRVGFATVSYIATYLRQGVAKFRSRFGLTALSDASVCNYTQFLGFIDGVNGIPTGGMFFRYNHAVNSGRWEAVCQNGVSNITAVDTGVSANITGFSTFAIESNSAGTSYGFYINGTLVATITTNIIPISKTIGWGANAIRTVGTAATNVYIIDYIMVDVDQASRT